MIFSFDMPLAEGGIYVNPHVLGCELGSSIEMRSIDHSSNNLNSAELVPQLKTSNLTGSSDLVTN